MPRQNRVTPFSTLIATAARGTLMGNRGCLHDEHGHIRRSYLGERWIICLLEFKGRRRPIMQPGRYTELFFLDEATALAAGHRPCAECQRERFNLFRETWATANPELTDSAWPSATNIDASLHKERIGGAPFFCEAWGDLPDGVFVTSDEKSAYLVINKQLLRWTPSGYEPKSEPGNLRLDNPVRVLTPVSIVRTLGAGYPVNIQL